MDDRKHIWAPPEMEVISFTTEDIIRTSGNTTVRTDSGSGDRTTLNDLFGDEP